MRAQETVRCGRANAWARIGRAACAALVAVSAGCAPSARGFSAGARPPECRVAILPLANYSPTRDASECIAPMLASDLGNMPGVWVIDAGAVEAALASEPWLLTDRVPPDLLDRLGRDLQADAILLGSVLAYGYRDSGGEKIPQLSLSFRLVLTPGGRVLWSAVHSRDGCDSEWLFGMGRVHSLEQLASKTVSEILVTFPEPGAHLDSAQKPVVGAGGQ